MIIRLYIFVLTILCLMYGPSALAKPQDVPDFPPSSDESWVELASGEWLKGEITAFYDAVLYFDSGHFGNIDVGMSDIRQVIGQGEFEVTIVGDSALIGSLQIIGDLVIINAGDQQHEYGRTDLVAFAPEAEREWDRWSGDVGTGLNLRRGNTEIAEATLAFGLVRRTPVTRVALDYLGQVNETEGERVADAHRANISIDRFTGRRFFWRPASIHYYHDRFQNIQHQATVDTGVGYQVIDSHRIKWDVQAGIGVNYLRNVSVADGDSKGETSPVGTLGTDLLFEVTSRIDYELHVDMNFLNDESGRYQHHVITSLSTDLFGNLDFDTSLIWDRTQKPQRQEDGTLPEKDDIRVIFGLGYDF